MDTTNWLLDYDPDQNATNMPFIRLAMAADAGQGWCGFLCSIFMCTVVYLCVYVCDCGREWAFDEDSICGKLFSKIKNKF